MLHRTLVLSSLLLALAGGLTAVHGAPLFTIGDPAQDDAGDGTLGYPRDTAFTPGDLDLRFLRVFDDGDRLRFEAGFANPIRHPASVQGTGLGSEALSVFARRGFYAFNLDIYIDTDRVPGAGHQVTLPGRGAVIDAGHAWDKVVVLTPRPELMQRQLREAVAAAAPDGGTDADVDAAVFFASDVRVRGRTVEFAVPRAFFGGADLRESSFTAMVTLAKLSIESEFSVLPTAAGAVPRISLGVQPPQAGRPDAAMGYTSERAPATSVVDLLTPDAQQQARQLTAGAAISGLNRRNGWGTQPEPASLATAFGAMAPAPSRLGRGLLALARGQAGVVSAPVPAVMPAPGRAATTTTPASAGPTAPAPAAATSSKPAPREAVPDTAEQRLLVLKRLRERELITEEEYQLKRRAILDAL